VVHPDKAGILKAYEWFGRAAVRTLHTNAGSDSPTAQVLASRIKPTAPGAYIQSFHAVAPRDVRPG